MFDNKMFFSDFWEWFIIVPTVGGILMLFALIIWMSLGIKRPQKGEDVKTMGHVWDGDLEEFNNPLPMWWLNMFYITLFFGIIYLILFPGLGSFKGYLGWTEVKQYEQEVDAANTRFGPLYEQFKTQPIPELIANKDALQIGQRLFITYCTACHGSDAGGGPGFPNLRDTDWLWGGTPEAIQATITNGRQAMMPDAKTNGLNEQDIKNVVQYVRSLSGLPHNADVATEGKKKFDTICMACHGMEGKGTQAMGAPNLTDNVWLYGRDEQTIEETVRYGRRGKMPAQLDFLGEAKVHLLATYIYSLSNTPSK
ncbi:cytochrome-c oxidase, cbb3-type subunit III [Beggiatoa leptomitoformis]|uniref:Cbb3-type cytochrome c oxidase subunit n=1 Tax=Beggiatoa leptomitoformis TaxID=288004 RepID=A0A2N9YIV7_9GAMM|nr:cytochrome-c oxidase, cbb3-type subunit III [Beggiatoa leptomitoformis]ALG67338.1 cytochrome-c oxidase, cbb3-type subunit III [Beggiatoa leptomitoformis]AUI70462.1 cytochrome-c oxidase, cbb3-type subunit III [Beggiatoa leptomitoformis]